MKTPIVILAVAGAGVLATLGFAYSGIYDVSASSPHSGFTNWLLSTASHASVERRAKDVEVPDLADEALVLAGINDFDSMCTGCHGAPGKDPEAMGKGLNPPAPDLAEEADEMSAAELFWITKHGIKMTGMPAWGATHGDDAIWPVVAFMTRLPELDAAGYQQMLAAAAGHGHHAESGAAAEHSHEENSESAGEAGHEHADAAPEAAHSKESAASGETSHAHADAAPEAADSHTGGAGAEAAHEHSAADAHEEPAAEPEEHDHSTHEHD